MANTHIILNAGTFYPTSVDMTPERIADVSRMRSGKLKVYHWANKYTWDITWNGVHESQVAAIRAIGLQTSTFGFTDVDGTTYTVVVSPGGYSQSLSAERQSIGGTYYYDITLTIIQE
jgi:hypothetical protein